VTYDGSEGTDPGRPGSLVVQIVDSGSAKTFDCHVDAFAEITGARTGVFPIIYEPVDCDTAPGQGAVVTVLGGNNAWYTKVIFSNLPQGVHAAKLQLDGATFPMTRVGGATWSASPGGRTGVASFVVSLEGGDSVEFKDCFAQWPVPTLQSCFAEPSSSQPATTTALATTATATATTTATTTTTKITVTSSAVEPGCGQEAIRPGDTVLFKAHTGNRVTVDGGTVHAKWSDTGSWQRLVIEREGTDPVHSGDAVYLRAHTGKLITVQGTQVHAKWGNKGSWEALVIEKAGGGGEICRGDSIYLRAHTGGIIAVQGTEVHAKWRNRGSWERFTIERLGASLLSQ